MLKRLSMKMVPLCVSIVASATFVGCGGEADIAELEQQLTETKAGAIGQADFDGYTNAVKLKNCTFVVGGGNATFTPSSELSQVLYGDPNGAAHKSTFAVPPIVSPSATVDITSLEAEMAITGLTLAGSNATVKLAFHGQLHVVVTVPVFGKLPADIVIKSSNLTTDLTYDKATERAKAAAVKANFNISTKNCGGSGWCNGIIDGILKTNLATWVEAPLRDSFTKALNSASVTASLYDGLAIMYNAKDPKPTQWTLAARSLELSTGAFRFSAQRTTP